MSGIFLGVSSILAAACRTAMATFCAKAVLE